MNVLNSIKSLSNYNKHFFVAAGLILLSLFTFYPSFYTTTDERDYIENSYLIFEGNVVKTNPQCYEGASCGYDTGNGFISKYNLGLSFLFLPIVLIDWRLTFLFSVIVFILGLYIFKRLMEKRGIRSGFIYLYAVFPTFVYYSRKSMTEIVTLTIVLGIYYLLFEKIESDFRIKKFVFNYRFQIVGILSGIGVLIKYTNIIFILPLLIYWFIISVKPKVVAKAGESIFLGYETSKARFVRLLKDTLKLILAAVPFLIVFLLINQAFYGSPFRSGYYFSKEELLFIPDLVLPQLLKYGLILLLLYPGLLFLGLLSKNKHKIIIHIIFFLSLAFYIGFPAFEFNSGLTDFIFGLRLLIPILGLVMLTYIESLDWLLLKFKFRKVANVAIIAITIILIGNMFAMAYVFNVRLKELSSKSEAIYNAVPEGANYYSDNIEDRKLINEAFKKGKRWLFVIDN